MVYKGLAGWLTSGDYSIRGHKRVFLVKLLQADAEYICADLSSRSAALPLQSCGGPYIPTTNP